MTLKQRRKRRQTFKRFTGLTPWLWRANDWFYLMVILFIGIAAGVLLTSIASVLSF